MKDAPTADKRALESIGKRVRRQRGTRTQVAVATAARIDQSKLSRIETGDYPAITPALVLRLAVALDCDPSDLIGGLDEIAVIARFEAERAGAA